MNYTIALAATSLLFPYRFHLCEVNCLAGVAKHVGTTVYAAGRVIAGRQPAAAATAKSSFDVRSRLQTAERRGLMIRHTGSNCFVTSVPAQSTIG